MRQQAEGVGVALEVYQVVPFAGRDAVAGVVADVVLEKLSCALAEVRADGFLSAVAEGRVPQVVGEAGSADDAAQLGEVRAVKLRVMAEDEAAHVVAQTTAHAAHLQAVCEPVVYEDASRQREHLRLVLQAAERSGEDEAVVIALELGAVIALRLSVLLSKAFARQELFPLHLEASGL